MPQLPVHGLNPELRSWTVFFVALISAVLTGAPLVLLWLRRGEERTRGFTARLIACAALSACLFWSAITTTCWCGLHNPGC